MAETVEIKPENKDVMLCKKIVETLGGNGDQRVLLVGKAGIGKTRMAQMVDKEAAKDDLCYQTLWLHLNRKFKVNDKYVKEKKFEDEWSLYENIASQLSLYSDFEETEVGERDEDEEEEKKVEDLLKDLKPKIEKYLLEKKKAVEEKLEEDKKKKMKEAADKLEAEKKLVDPHAKKAKDPEKKNPTDAGKEKTTQVVAGGDTSSERKPYLLLILDDEGMTSEYEVMVHLGLEDFLKDHTPRKILITRRQENEEDTKSGEKIEGEDDSHSAEKKDETDGEDENKSRDTDTINEEVPESHAQIKAEEKPAPTIDDLWGGTNTYGEITFNNTNESQALLESFKDKEAEDLFRSIFKGMPDFFVVPVDGTDDIMSQVLKKSKNLPAAIVVLGKSLEYTVKSKSYELNKETEEKLLKEKIEMVLSAERAVPSNPESSSESPKKASGENPILLLAYKLFKTDGPLKDTILDCFWHSLDFFEHCGCVYYRDLITQWILEGYFDPVRSVEKAYQDGHSIFMELIDRGMLKIQENNVVVPEMVMRNVIDPRRGGHLGKSRLGFSRVYGGNKKKGIGKITQLDDMIKTVQAKKGDKITTILVSGDRLRRETPAKFFKKLKELEVLGLFEPTLEFERIEKPVDPSFTDQLKPSVVPPFTDHLILLRVLVIRDCDLLKGIEELKALTKLNALEVSGASSLKKISDDFFKSFLELRSLHLSGLKIKSSPPSISDLKELHCLIIKDCPLLEDLPNIQELLNLEVVDISGARGLQTCFDNAKDGKKNKSKNKNFYLLTKLQLLDFSESQIERLPIFQDSAVAAKLHSLTRLLLRNCSKLRRLPSLKPLSGLQILDLSGTTSLVEMLEVCFEDKHELKTLNLSGTNLSELATTIEELSSLNELLLRDCINLDAIPNIQKLENLEVIDVSGSAKLAKIEGSFENMFYLREVNLFGTKVETPELPNDTKIHCVKRFTRADGKYFERDTWSKIKKDIERDRSENASSSDAVVESQEILEETREIQSVEPRASDRTEKGDVSKERLLKVPKERALYKKTLSSLVDSEIPQEVLEINETNELDKDALANAEFVSFVDCTPERLTSIFNETKSVKGCWLRMCFDIKDLFAGVDEEHLKSLETLSITNLLSLETISSVGKLENLKNLSLDCCPKIKTIFPEMPASLPVLNLKHCENLEKVVVGVEVSTHTNLNLEVENCPKFNKILPSSETTSSEYVMVDRSDVPPPQEC
ncbi:hypothetical protein ARALYDRAFT_494432 [Arabidopsis lyrata subsp. lyrata]|uniref:NB-ARC domain-containing protein n=1 Tax=Arabidopsis lyrata subsp. lyrata TaxID=81972 RepID=D7MU10_ARALL|nr:probable disease resistance protein At5g45510 isoform X1 [Arabidopsis lyrata subsp. lyrata]XP_020871519.1 probable disease resistance protein At5g45510 isoform X2 [Arabidopsis lyrata subsp. lyrata]EFH41498.1 hypothetical protein ARALYDRAFT_494432 [Arabidopsis lyrata subsp. lyrata]|eukprot:XP_020871518.1 probable disease resistance protein At5g45510 isoform X1 [Arabidopsis lyrata subsp. lyrata]